MKVASCAATVISLCNRDQRNEDKPDTSAKDVNPEQEVGASNLFRRHWMATTPARKVQGIFVSLSVAERRRTEERRYTEFTRWERERDPRLGALRALRQAVTHTDYDERVIGLGRYSNEKRSRVAETLTATHHERLDYYDVDLETGDVIIQESDGIRPRYTFRQVYENGLETSSQLAETRPELAFQERRDEIFLQVYEQVAAMLAGEADFDHLQMVSTFPVDELIANRGAVEDKKYDLDYGKQFKYDFRARRGVDGSVKLEMLTTTLYCAPSDLEPGGTDYGKQALAALQHYHGVEAPLLLLSSHEQTAYVTTRTTVDDFPDLLELSHMDVALYDHTLQQLTGQESQYGRQDASIEAYALFNHYFQDWWAYDRLYEQLALHLEGTPLAPELQTHLLKLMDGYRSVDKINGAMSQAEFNRLYASLLDGSIPGDLDLACNELLDYAHSALMYRYLARYKETGVLLEPGNRDYETNVAGYSADAGDASDTAVAMGMDFNDCEFGNSPAEAAAAMAAAEGIGFSEALNRILSSRERRMAGDLKCVKCPLPGCGKTVDAVRVKHKEGRGIMCPACNRVALSDGRIVTFADDSAPKAEVRRSNIKQMRAGEVYTLGGQRMRAEEKVAVGGTVKYMADSETGEKLFDGWL